MKRFIAIALVSAVTLSLAACGDGSEAEETETAAVETEEEAVEEETEEVTELTGSSIPENIQNDFSETIEQLVADLETVYENVGDSYDDYVDNKDYLTEWYDACETAVTELSDRTYDSSIDYYKYVADTVDRDDYDAVNDALDEFYYDVINDAYDDFYYTIIDDKLEEINDKYSEILGGDSDSEDDLEDDLEVSDEYSDFYNEWSEAYADIYNELYGSYSELYNDWIAIWSAFALDGNFDVDSIL